MTQVDDDLDLLNQILEDEESENSNLSATARWATYSDSFVMYLKEEGLKDFRSRKHGKGTPGTVLAQFGAVDHNPSFERPGGKPEEMYHAARACFLGKGAKRIEELEAFRVGSPEGFEIDDRFYTLSWLNFYCRYAYVSQRMRFKNQVIIEVGPGSGKQAEMLKRAHPDLTIVLFDLPTQIYVCNQYLKKVFEGTDEVADYRAGRGVKSFDRIQRGKINIFPYWKFAMIEGVEFDLFWNAASLQEMGPDTATRYLQMAAGAKAIYLLHNIKYRQAAKYPGDRGMINATNLAGFTEAHRELARLAFPLQTWLYYDSFWKEMPPQQDGARDAFLAQRTVLTPLQRIRRKIGRLVSG